VGKGRLGIILCGAKERPWVVLRSQGKDVDSQGKGIVAMIEFEEGRLIGVGICDSVWRLKCLWTIGRLLG